MKDDRKRILKAMEEWCKVVLRIAEYARANVALPEDDL